jgi:hypothetical protein
MFKSGNQAMGFAFHLLRLHSLALAATRTGFPVVFRFSDFAASALQVGFPICPIGFPEFQMGGARRSRNYAVRIASKLALQFEELSTYCLSLTCSPQPSPMMKLA